MLTSAALHGSGTIHVVMPWWVTNTVMVAFGAVTGSRFAGTPLRLLAHFIGAAFGSFAVAVAVTAVFAAGLVGILALPIGEVMIAYAPGAVDAMMLLALALNLDPVYVGAHHLVRIFFVSLAMPLLARRAARARKAAWRRRKPPRQDARLLRAIGLFRRQRLLAGRQLEPVPHVDQRFRQRVDQRVVVIGRRRDAQPFLAARHGRIVDRLDVDAVLGEQQVARRLALLGVADQHRHDMGVDGITGRPAALSTALTRAARSWCRSRSHCEVFRCRMAAVAAAQIAGGSAVVKMKPGA